MGSVKVGNKVFSSDVNGISKAKAYSTLTDQPIKSDSFSLSNRNKFLKKGGSLKALSPNKDISSVKSGYGNDNNQSALDLHCLSSLSISCKLNFIISYPFLSSFSDISR